MLDGKVGRWCCRREAGGGRRLALLSPVVGIDPALESDQRDLHCDLDKDDSAVKNLSRYIGRSGAPRLRHSNHGSVSSAVSRRRQSSKSSAVCRLSAGYSANFVGPLRGTSPHRVSKTRGAWSPPRPPDSAASSTRRGTNGFILTSDQQCPEIPAPYSGAPTLLHNCSYYLLNDIRPLTTP